FRILFPESKCPAAYVCGYRPIIIAGFAVWNDGSHLRKSKTLKASFRPPSNCFSREALVSRRCHLFDFGLRNVAFRLLATEVEGYQFDDRLADLFAFSGREGLNPQPTIEDHFAPPGDRFQHALRYAVESFHIEKQRPVVAVFIKFPFLNSNGEFHALLAG